MIKIKFKNKTLNEVEISHSDTARKAIYDLFLKFVQQPNNVLNQVIYIPLKEIIQNTKHTRNGLPLFMTGYSDKEFSSLKNSWDAQKKEFNKETIDNFLNQQAPILYVHWNKSTSSPGSVDVGGKGTQQLFKLSLNASRLDKNSVHRVIRHELQHITDKINSICRKYYYDLLKIPNNIENIKKINLHYFDKPSDSIKSGSQIHTEPQEIKDRESFLKYLRHDEEYKTWLSDSLDTIIQWIFSNSGDMKKYMLQMKYKDMLQGADLMKRKQISKLASENSVNLSTAYTSDDMAIYYVNMIFSNEKVLNNIMTLNTSFKDFIDEMDKARIKYIRKDLAIGLSKRFKKIYQPL